MKTNIIRKMRITKLVCKKCKGTLKIIQLPGNVKGTKCIKCGALFA